MKDIKEELSRIIGSSNFISSIRAVKEKRGESVLFGDSIRKLTEDEIKILKGNGNYCNDWSLIAVVYDFNPGKIINSLFFGKCVLGKFTGETRDVAGSISLPTGIYRSTIINSEIGNEVFILGNGSISGYIIKSGAAVINTVSLSHIAGGSFGNGLELAIGIETGGREVLSFAELTIDTAARIATERDNEQVLSGYNRSVKDYTEAAKSSFGVVEKNARILNTVRVANSYIGDYAVINGANVIENSTILSGSGEETEISGGAYVRNSCIQWGCSVSSMAIVDSSVLTEHSHVERHGKVTESIIGPNTEIAEGEVTSCIVGPFVGFHHQSLLIAAIWPEGRGNVGYGANVGSNHTSKAPDQEIFCGEGTFFGLGVNIKFPSDFSAAPYSIIATGVSTLPQKVEFPFSLINEPAAHFPGISPAYNEIFPAWVLSDNIYMIRRNEGKYRKRNKAKRTQFIYDVFRPDIIDRMIRARETLLSVRIKKDIYLDKDIRGIGKNFLLEKNRVKAIETYSYYIRYYALSGIKKMIDKIIGSGRKIRESMLHDKLPENKRWEHEHKILCKEGLADNGIKENLKLLLEMEEKIARSTGESKAKDDKRGKRIIKDYTAAHKPAEEDSFVIETWKKYHNLRKEIESYEFCS
ncbi:MAG: DUF4954 family protein [Spirochaetes bacterium]|nr:DUF4954 family protein [Spirochaetota bacterium]